MTGIQIRAPEPTDAEDLAQLFNCPGVVAGTLQLPWRSVEHRRERLAEQRPDSYPLVAVVDGRVVALLDLHIQQNPRQRQCAGIGMAVHDDYQGKGIGSALVSAMIDLADNWLGLGRIELTVFSDNGTCQPW